MFKKYFHITYLIIAVILAITVTFRIWRYQLFSDDWIWLLISEEVNPLNLRQLIWVQFSGFWRPTMTLWFMVTRFLNDFNPLAQHLLSAILLSLNAFLLGLVVKKYSQSFWAGIIAIIFFIFNCAGAEVWLWYSAVGDLLMGLFLLILLLCFDGKNTVSKIIFGGLAFILLLFTKETAIIFIVAILFWPYLQHYNKKFKIILALMYLPVIILYLIGQSHIGLSRSHEISLSLDKILFLIVSWWQMVFYNFGQILRGDFWLLLFFSLIVCCLILLSLFKYFKSKSIFNRTIAWFTILSFLIIGPTVLLPLNQAQLLPSRYLFVPSLCLAAALGMIWSRIVNKNLKIMVVILVIISSINSLQNLHNVITKIYQPFDRNTSAVIRSIGQYLKDANGDVYVACSFPYENNAGYLKALVRVRYHFNQQHLIFLADETSPATSRDVIIAWSYPQNKFIQIQDIKNLNCLSYR